MKTKIQKIYPQSIFCSSRASNIYIVDFTERTDVKRKVEFHEAIPQVPNSSKNMDCLIFVNQSQLSVVCNIFDDNQFKDENGKDIQHCECVLFPECNKNNTGVAFVEIKDCKLKNVSVYKKKAKEQIISTVQIFRDKGIINMQRVYGIISFPRRNVEAINGSFVQRLKSYVI